MSEYIFTNYKHTEYLSKRSFMQKVAKLVKKNPTKWLDVILDGKMVQINEKGKVRRVKNVRRT